ncbi:DNA polymerase-4 [Hypnocyclicus thermotrophus]|uniref:DNA polymerase IV n=1 Tax=Hypnocyclicus thermotrophus TaxID=1627895 RepID=A0AA46E1K4_9FUSO|nr:DNA polymerase IV [Hypnocyclicus thermotrophus]TDT72543.1 DNA polymerase-4 [Hypnocyclicus thermotrophus]
MKKQVIMHYDMDAFYASIEIRDNAKLKGKPVIVGTRVITTCNYEARKYGLHSAMSVTEARKLCPNGIYLNVDKNKYIKVAYQIQNLIKKLTDNIEFIAFDEGYIDITNIINKYPSYEYFIKKFKKRIYIHTKLTCSVGIGYNKLTAKLASEVNKPGGFFIIKNNKEYYEYFKEKDIKILPGIGEKTQKFLRQNNINRIREIKEKNYYFLKEILGSSKAQLLYDYSRGIDYRKIKTERKYKSIGNEITFKFNTDNKIIIFNTLDDIFNKIYKRLINKKYYAKTLVLKIRFEDRHIITRSKTLKDFSENKIEFIKLLEEFKKEFDYKNKIRLIGLTFSNIITHKNEQLTLIKKKLD